VRAYATLGQGIQRQEVIFPNSFRCPLFWIFQSSASIRFFWFSDTFLMLSPSGGQSELAGMLHGPLASRMEEGRVVQGRQRLCHHDSLCLCFCSLLTSLPLERFGHKDCPDRLAQTWRSVMQHRLAQTWRSVMQRTLVYFGLIAACSLLVAVLLYVSSSLFCRLMGLEKPDWLSPILGAITTVITLIVVNKRFPLK
jgi:hypothetical protein